MQDNRREFLRVRQGFPVEIERSRGELIEVAAKDVSRGGVRLECEPGTAQTLGVDKTQRSEESAEELTLYLQLPFLCQASQRVRARAELLHVTRSEKGTYHLGLRFVSFPGDGYEVLESYILEWMRYAST